MFFLVGYLRKHGKYFFVNTIEVVLETILLIQKCYISITLASKFEPVSSSCIESPVYNSIANNLLFYSTNWTSSLTTLKAINFLIIIDKFFFLNRIIIDNLDIIYYFKSYFKCVVASTWKQ
jgi:hypothetical protein